MTSEEIRQKKNQLVADMTRVGLEIAAITSKQLNEILKVNEEARQKSWPLKDRMALMQIALELIQKECKYHRLDGFYGHCSDCAYYVADTRRDGLKAHP